MSINGLKTEIAHQTVGALMPQKFAVYQNYPNPFNATTTFVFDVPQKSLVKIKLYNVLGQRVKTLVNKHYDAGRFKYHFNANDLASGLYFYTFEASDYRESKKLLLVK